MLIDNHLINDTRVLHRSKTTTTIRNAISDHYLILIDNERNDTSNQNLCSQHRVYRQLSLNDSTRPILSQHLSDINWDDDTPHQDSTANFANFYHKFLNATETALTVSVNVHFTPVRPRFNANHHTAIGECNRVHQIY